MTATPTTLQDPPRRTFWQRWFVDPLMRQLTQGVTPRKLALSIAVASALALFPIVGTTTTLCVLAGIALGLNQPVIQGVNLLCTFVYFPLIVAFVRLGDTLAGSKPSSLDIPRMVALATHHPRDFLPQFGVTAAHAMLGWVVVAPLWIPLIYGITLSPLRSAARRLGREEA